MKIILSLTLLLLICVSSWANERCTSGSHSTSIFFLNGIWVDETGPGSADEASKLLALQLKKLLSASEYSKICVTYLHNTSLSKFEDFIEAVNQAAGQDIDVSSLLRHLGDLDSAPAAVKYAFITTSSVLVPSDIVTEDDLADHIRRYLEQIDAQRTVIVVPHSQGNFFANEAFVKLQPLKNLPDSSKFNIVSVATPSDHVAGYPDQNAARYTTLCEDFIWKPVPLVSLPSPKKWNLYNDLFVCATNQILPLPVSAATAGHISHSFNYGYLHEGTASWSKILTDIVEFVDVSPPIPNEPPTAVFTMTSIPYLPVPNGETLNLTVAAGGSVSVTFSAGPCPTCTPPSPGSSDPDGQIVAWEWRIGSTVASTDSMFTHSFAAGSHTIALVVRDDKGDLSAPVTGTVIVTEESIQPGTRRYSLTDLGVLPNGTYSAATAINNRGEVVGYSHTSESSGYSNCFGANVSSPFIWAQSTGMLPLDSPPPVDFGYGNGVRPCGGSAHGINDDGLVVGSLNYGSGSGVGLFRPFVWKSGNGMQVLMDGNGGAKAVNNLGLVVGGASYNAFRWSSAMGFETLGIAAQDSGASGVNDLNQVVGYSQIEACNRGPVVWDSEGHPQWLTLSNLIATLPVHEYLCANQAIAINNTGTVIGSVLAIGIARPQFGWIYKDGAAESLGELPGSEGTGTTPLGINNSEHVVGESKGSAFIWTRANGIRDLNSLLDESAAGWRLNAANAINDNGQIVGYGLHNGEQKAFLLNPIRP